MSFWVLWFFSKKTLLTVRKDLKQGHLQRTSGNLLFLEHRMRKGIKEELRLPGAGTEERYAIVNRFGFFCRGNQKGISERKCNYQKVLSQRGMEKNREVAPPPGDM